MSKLAAIAQTTKVIAKSPIANPHTGRVILTLRKSAPSILVYSGVAGMVGSTVLACRQMFEAHHIHATATAERTRMKSYVEKNPESEEAKTIGRDITRSYVKECGAQAKVMGVPLTLGVISIASILAGHNMLNKRHAALAASYLTLQNTYNEYREAVAEALGEDVERDIRTGLSQENGAKDANGVVKPNASLYSPYAKYFDETNRNHNADVTYNVQFLRNVQNHMNDRLRAYGYVFLNDVYEALGYPRTKSGQVVGWMLNNPAGTGDGYIDFGVWDSDNARAYDFINGWEDGIWLDFNVDGPILDMLNVGEF